MRTRARDKNGNIVYINEAQHGTVYFDDMFNDLEMIPVQGSIKEWHFRYKSGQDRDTWADYDNSMSEFHIAQQALFPIEEREIPVYPHRADVLTGGNTVIEIQHSWLSREEVSERTDFYINKIGSLVWVLDASENAYELVFCNDAQKKGLRAFEFKQRKFFGNFQLLPQQEIFLYVGNNNEINEYIHVLYVVGDWEMVYGNKMELPHFMSYINILKNRGTVIEDLWCRFKSDLEEANIILKKQKEAAEELARKQEAAAAELKRKEEEFSRNYEISRLKNEVGKLIKQIEFMRNQFIEEWDGYINSHSNACHYPMYYMRKALDEAIKQGKVK